MRKEVESVEKKIKIGSRYILLSLLASLLFAAGIVGRVMPGMLEFAGTAAAAAISEYWWVLLVVGLMAGSINAYLTFSSGRRIRDERRGAVVQKG